MKHFIQSTSVALCAVLIPSLAAPAQETGAPAVLGAYLKPGESVRGQVVVVVPPEGINAFVEKVEMAAQKDPEWFKEYSKNAKPGVPLPFHEKLGLTKPDYDKYIALWDEREVTPVPDGNATVQLEQLKSGEWKIGVFGKLGTRISLLRYDAAADAFKSPNGSMTRLEDIDADPRSILGKWTGHEWKYEDEDSLEKMKENFAIGKLAGTKYGLLVYRFQATTALGRPNGDLSLVIRFPLNAK
jgi:hypothetical protein